MVTNAFRWGGHRQRVVGPGALFHRTAPNRSRVLHAGEPGRSVVGHVRLWAPAITIGARRRIAVDVDQRRRCPYPLQAASLQYDGIFVHAGRLLPPRRPLALARERARGRAVRNVTVALEFRRIGGSLLGREQYRASAVDSASVPWWCCAGGGVPFPSFVPDSLSSFARSRSAIEARKRHRTPRAHSGR